MVVLSAGLLVWKRAPGGGLLVLLAHPGGPLWTRKDEGAWSIPKGEVEPGEDPYAAAVREFNEETGAAPPDGPSIALGEIRQRSGKHVVAWGIEGTFNPAALAPGHFELEWPPKSGRLASFPEIDRVEWFDLDTARRKLLGAQWPLVEALVALVG